MLKTSTQRLLTEQMGFREVRPPLRERFLREGSRRPVNQNALDKDMEELKYVEDKINVIHRELIQRDGLFAQLQNHTDWLSWYDQVQQVRKTMWNLRRSYRTEALKPEESRRDQRRLEKLREKIIGEEEQEQILETKLNTVEAEIWVAMSGALY